MEEVAPSRASYFPKKLRITKPEEFRYLFRTGKKLHTENLVLYIKSNSLGHPRIGISIGRKAAAKSVDRNRIKRLLRESFRTNKTDFNENDIIVVVKNNISQSKMSDVLSEIKSALLKLQ